MRAKVSGTSSVYHGGPCACPACSKVSSDPQSISTATKSYAVAKTPTAVKALDSGTKWDNDGNGLTITYKFLTALPSYYSNSDTEATNFQAFTQAMKDATKDVLNQLSTFTKITFQEVSGSTDSTMTFAQAKLTAGAGAWAYYPTSHQKGGDVWTNNMYANTQNVTKGTYGFLVLLHEIGHALGLKHSFEGSSKLSKAQDNTSYSVMSYTWPFFSESYMLYDIAALQSKYGANTTYNSGNNTYTMTNTKGFTVWDTGGTDTLDGSSVTNAMNIDLNAGKHTTINNIKYVSIAFGVTIENAKGGSGNDIITGNDGANDLEGGSGNDTIKGGKGDDILAGGIGDDILDGGLGNDIIVMGQGKDTVVGGAGVDTFKFNSLDSTVDTIKDFKLKGQPDKLDISDILSGYNSAQDDLNDFVKLEVMSKGANLKVNWDGAGNDWVHIAIIQGSSFKGVTVDAMEASGQLITV